MFDFFCGKNKGIQNPHPKHPSMTPSHGRESHASQELSLSPHTRSCNGVPSPPKKNESSNQDLKSRKRMEIDGLKKNTDSLGNGQHIAQWKSLITYICSMHPRTSSNATLSIASFLLDCEHEATSYKDLFLAAGCVLCKGDNPSDVS